MLGFLADFAAAQLGVPTRNMRQRALEKTTVAEAEAILRDASKV